MADITVTCLECGNAITISEFVTAEMITCMKCKSQVPVPVRSPDLSSAGSKLKLAMPKPPEPIIAPPPPVTKAVKKDKRIPRNNVQQYLPQGGKRRVRARKISTFEVKVLPWLLFFVLLLVFGWLRYIPGVLAPDIQQMFIQGGVWAICLLHVSVICLAFGEDAFSGILCFIIPGFSIYYLFTQADQILLRGLVGALLIVFGWDFALAAGTFWNEVYVNISHWIATTETMKKP